MGKYFGTDGIRGKAERFSTEFVQAIARGLTLTTEPQQHSGLKVLIGGDTRESTEWILHDLESSFETLGVEYGNVGVLPTPAINYAFYAMGFDYAVDVTASHNPATDNGIKIFERGATCGEKLNDNAKTVIENAIDENKTYDLAATELREDLHTDALSRYLDYLRQYVGKVDLSGMKIGLDCANGAMSVIGGKLFEEMGAEVRLINCNDNYGKTINSNCGSTHPEQLQQLVRDEGLSLGAAFDGDGDRCMMVDENGELVDGDLLIAILTDFLKLPSMAVSVMAGQGLLEWAKTHGIEIETTPVGDQYIAEAMKRNNIKIGGEQNGHIILPEQAMGDGMLTALMTVKAVATSGKTLGSLAKVVPKYPQITHNMAATAIEKTWLDDNDVLTVIHDAEAKLNDLGGRLLIRPSGTEDVVRITMWGKDETEIQDLAEKLAKDLREMFNQKGA